MKKTILLFAVLITLTMKTQAQTVSDYDGNVYNTVTIGSQLWMKENLKTTHFRNGVEIPNVTTPWFGLTTSAYCDYENASMNVATYGRLYNWFATNDTSKLCPAGWHVPSDGDWTLLSICLGNDSTAGGKLKEAGTVHWSGPNTGATNSSGFTALPGGNRSYDNNGTFGGLRDRGHWWSSSELSSDYAYHRSLYYDNEGFFIVLNGYIKRSGFSVRCVCDTLMLNINETNPVPGLNIYPNPTHQSSTLQFNNPYNENFSLTLYNTFGQLVREISNITTDKVNIERQDLKSGMYFFRLTGDGKLVGTGKMLME